jgi:ATP synthase protein I
MMMNFKDISTRLKIAKKNIKVIEEKKSGSNATSFGKALKISTELVAAVVVGSTIGFLLDSWFDTKPLLIICFFFAGVGAGILNVFRAAKRMQKKNNNI